MVTNILMFIGGGSAGTAGGIKITTFLVLGFAIWNEVRGRDEVTIAHRSISASSQRQALSVALLGVAAVVSGTLLLLMSPTTAWKRSCSSPSPRSPPWG